MKLVRGGVRNPRKRSSSKRSGVEECEDLWGGSSPTEISLGVFPPPLVRPSFAPSQDKTHVSPLEDLHSHSRSWKGATTNPRPRDESSDRVPDQRFTPSTCEGVNRFKFTHKLRECDLACPGGGFGKQLHGTDVRGNHGAEKSFGNGGRRQLSSPPSAVIHPVSLLHHRLPNPARSGRRTEPRGVSTARVGRGYHHSNRGIAVRWSRVTKSTPGTIPTASASDTTLPTALSSVSSPRVALLFG